MSTTIELENGKYTVIHDNGVGFRALRHGEPWRDLCGDGLVLAMAQRIEELEQRVAELTPKPEMVDLFGEKPNGETVLLGQVAMPDLMKAKDIIANYFGRNFSDEDSPESYALYAFQDFLAWQKEQRARAESSGTTQLNS